MPRPRSPRNFYRRGTIHNIYATLSISYLSLRQVFRLPVFLAEGNRNGCGLSVSCLGGHGAFSRAASSSPCALNQASIRAWTASSIHDSRISFNSLNRFRSRPKWTSIASCKSMCEPESRKSISSLSNIHRASHQGKVKTNPSSDSAVLVPKERE